MPSSQRPSNRPVPTGEGLPRTSVYMRQKAHVALAVLSRAAAPSECFGALIGRSATSATSEVRLVVEEVAPVQMLAAGTGLVPDMEAWAEIEARFGFAPAATDNNPPRILGWYYSDPAIGIFRLRTDLLEVADLLGARGSLLLVVNPATGEEASYVRQGDHFVPAARSFEIAPEGNVQAIEAIEAIEAIQPPLALEGDAQGARWLDALEARYAGPRGNMPEPVGEVSEMGGVADATRAQLSKMLALSLQQP